jgi:hypothetical protein
MGPRKFGALLVATVPCQGFGGRAYVPIYAEKDSCIPYPLGVAGGKSATWITNKNKMGTGSATGNAG